MTWAPVSGGMLRGERMEMQELGFRMQGVRGKGLSSARFLGHRTEGAD